MAELIPTMGYFPDFVTPGVPMDELDVGLEMIRSTSAPIVRRDVLRLARPFRSSALAEGLLRGEPSALTELTTGMSALHTAAVQPYERTIRAAIERDRGIRASALARGGVVGLLESFRPTMAWSFGELRIPSHPDQELHLDGRGLVLIPSYFCVSHPMTLLDGSLPPVLVYPIDRGEHGVLRPNGHESLSLGPLIGRTRARVLESIGAGASTLELARRVGIASASASEHVTVMRQAGLVTSHRHGNRMVHQLTALGSALLRAGITPDPSP